MPGHDIIVIGASAGGMAALKQVVSGLPADLPAAVFVVWHLSPQSQSILPVELRRAGPLRADNARDNEPIRPGRIYVAPPDYHLVLEESRVRTTRSPKENRFRPAVDPLFRSAALAHGRRVVGVILTGALDDGTAGLWAIKARGGVAVVQDPLEAEFPSMPLSALKYVQVDHRLPVHEIAPLLARLARAPIASGVTAMPEELEVETAIALEKSAYEAGIMELGNLSPFTCPECHGTLLQMKTGGVLRFRCHTGHAYSHNSLLADLSESVEDALWNAVRVVEEGAMLMKHMSRHLQTSGEEEAAEAFERKSTDAKRRADLVRRAVMQQEALTLEKPSDPQAV
jgi:two-component system, chemotaxis family, protein-glutamate methylesterase/glutaminase